MASQLLEYDAIGIQACQRNRYPLLFVDRIYDVEPGVKATGLKCFSYNEWFFPAHFDDEPNVPGFVQVESLVQTFIMTFLTLDGNQGKKTNFLKINNVNFKRKIIPGETLIINAKLDSFRRGLAIGSANSFVDGEIACSAEFVVALPDILTSFAPRN
jgi:3-hydroxyacyl-[acyl-carrier-protein] dehydratase